MLTSERKACTLPFSNMFNKLEEQSSKFYEPLTSVLHVVATLRYTPSTF